MATVKVSWSGGKDSTCALMLHLEQGDHVKAVCYIPMFDEEIPMLLKNHYDFIMDTAEKFRKMGAEVYIVHGETYFEHVLKVAKKGIRKGCIRGFPLFIAGKCGFARDSKIKTLQHASVGEYDYSDIGIAYDEIKRQKQLTSDKRSILYEKQYTEQMALQYCKEHGVLSPHYMGHKRDGCALCPNAKATERKKWFAEYPQAFKKVIYLQEQVKAEMKAGKIPADRTPLRNHKWFIEKSTQASMFPEDEKYIIN